MANVGSIVTLVRLVLLRFLPRLLKSGRTGDFSEHSIWQPCQPPVGATVDWARELRVFRTDDAGLGRANASGFFRMVQQC
jgi:hypothetical protein